MNDDNDDDDYEYRPSKTSEKSAYSATLEEEQKNLSEASALLTKNGLTELFKEVFDAGSSDTSQRSITAKRTAELLKNEINTSLIPKKSEEDKRRELISKLSKELHKSGLIYDKTCCSRFRAGLWNMFNCCSQKHYFSAPVLKNELSMQEKNNLIEIINNILNTQPHRPTIQ